MEELSSQVYKLKDITNFQKDSIVSKMIIAKETGTVTFFAFDKDQELREHTAPYNAMITIIEGKVEIIISKKKINLEKDEMIIMPANKPHALKTKEKLKMMLIMIKS